VSKNTYEEDRVMGQEAWREKAGHGSRGMGHRQTEIGFKCTISVTWRIG